MYSKIRRRYCGGFLRGGWRCHAHIFKQQNRFLILRYFTHSEFPLNISFSMLTAEGREKVIAMRDVNESRLCWKTSYFGEERRISGHRSSSPRLRSGGRSRGEGCSGRRNRRRRKERKCRAELYKNTELTMKTPGF
jgi:hypothetical protein